MEAYLKRTVVWYGGVGLLTSQVFRSLALPPKDFRLIVQEMKVTEQIDALRTLGVNYIKRLVVHRVLAALIVFPLLTVLADAIGVLGGMLIMYLERGADVYAYWNITTYWVVP